MWHANMTKAEEREWERLGPSGQAHIYHLQGQGRTVLWDSGRGRFTVDGVLMGKNYWRKLAAAQWAADRR